MKLYDRTTTSATRARLPAPMADALADRVESAGITLGDAPLVYVTHSTRLKKPGFLARRLGGDPDAEHLTALVIGPRDLLVVTSGEKRGTAVLTCRLSDAEIGASLAGVEEDGMSVRGFPVGGPDGGVGSYFVGLGPPDGEGARDALREAIRAAKAT